MADRAAGGAARWATLVAVPLALLAGLGVFAALGGFAGDRSDDQAGASPSPAPPAATSPVPVDAPALAGRAQTVCRALLSRLPEALRDRARRPVTAGPEQNAAYGEPPVTVSCGVAPATFPGTDRVFTMDRVCWHAAETTRGTVWTTVDREEPVRVTVPRSYDSPGQWVIEFSAPVIAAVPSVPPTEIPSGCNP